jgi:uncharacterized membrane protein
MSLDLSPERHGSKADPSVEYKSGEEIMAEAERLEQVKNDAKYIAREIIKELDKREAEKETAETVPETIPAETVAVVAIPEPQPVDYTLPIVSAACGFLIGVLLTALCFIIKLNRIRRESERW